MVKFPAYRKYVVVLILLLPIAPFAQNKAQYSNLKDAIFSTYQLMGDPGPQSVNWINNGNQYSYIDYNAAKQQEEIHVFDPATLDDKLLFNNSSLHFPGTDSAFDYESFQWSHDSKHLVFKTNFRKIFRRSGI